MPRPGKRISVEGELKDFPFPRVLQFLIEHGVTGRLVLRRGEITKVVFMVEGKPVNVDSTLRDETLGRYLIKKGKISEEDFEKSIQLMISQSIQQGAALVKLGCLSPKELYHEVKAQTQAKLISCFAWTTGTFGFYPEVDFVEDIYRFEMSPHSVIREGIMRLFPPGAIEAQLAKVGPGPIVPVAGFMEKVAPFNLSEEESAFVLTIDGERNLLSLKENSADFPAASRLLYMLLLCGLIGPNGEPDGGVRGLGDKALVLPPIEEFVVSSEDSPEVVEEEVVSGTEGETGGDLDFTSELGEETSWGAAADITEEPALPDDDQIMTDEDFGAAAEEEGAFGDEGEEYEEEEEEIVEDIELPGLADSEDQVLPPLGYDVGKEKEPETEEPGIDLDYVAARTELGIVEDQLASESEAGQGLLDESEILERYMSVKSSDFFDLLQIGRDAGDLDVDRAYRALLSEWDKSMFKPGLSSEAQAKLEEIHTQIIRAYEALRTEETRFAYIKGLAGAGETPKLSESLQAEQYLQEGMKSVRQRDWAKAEAMFEKAVDSRPNEPEYLGYLGWSIYSNTDRDLEERKKKAKEMLYNAIDINVNMDSSHVFLAKIFKEEGKFDDAAREFRAALKANPKCREAERELAAHQAGEW